MSKGMDVMKVPVLAVSGRSGSGVSTFARGMMEAASPEHRMGLADENAWLRGLARMVAIRLSRSDLATVPSDVFEKTVGDALAAPNRLVPQSGRDTTVPLKLRLLSTLTSLPSVRAAREEWLGKAVEQAYTNDQTLVLAAHNGPQRLRLYDPLIGLRANVHLACPYDVVVGRMLGSGLEHDEIVNETDAEAWANWNVTGYDTDEIPAAVPLIPGKSVEDAWRTATALRQSSDEPAQFIVFTQTTPEYVNAGFARELAMLAMA